MLIGELSVVTGIGRQAIRFYERQGLLSNPERTGGGYRRYDDQAVTRLRFIRAAQAAGLTLQEILGTIQLRETGQIPCAHVAGLVEEKLADVRARQVELEMLAADLEQTVLASQHLDPTNCGDDEVCHIVTTPEHNLNRPRFDAASFRVERMASCRRKLIPRSANERSG
ncbi:heavy metal-responsive transcriptional regulator [Citricoccus sp. NR2]|uniref:heavy metal-responsive transcriptional regulator n=1 Tax=Citricoccus sp. NR2 TaxID=3004095 RepID=UPI0022DE2BE2|nr:heavy metal-responsive transcriptional regulator [Citricoccus sp. NR2]WBL20289.1 heavy metal-responsive transcriptional regulator [Citricoccus sp. NR2]